MIYDYYINTGNTKVHIHSQYLEVQPDYSGFPKSCAYYKVCVNASPDVIYGGTFLVDKTWNKLIYVFAPAWTVVVDLPFTPEDAALIQRDGEIAKLLFAHDGILETLTVNRNGNVTERRSVGIYDKLVGVAWFNGMKSELVYERSGELYRLGLKERKLSTNLEFEELHIMNITYNFVKSNDEYYVYKNRTKENEVVVKYANKEARFQMSGSIVELFIKDTVYTAFSYTTFTSTAPCVYDFICQNGVCSLVRYHIIMGKEYLVYTDNTLSTQLVSNVSIGYA